MGQLVKLVDGTFFHQNALGYAGENSLKHPDLMQWDRSAGEADCRVWTDITIHQAQTDPTPRRIALLVESPAISPKVYQTIESLWSRFQVVLIHQEYLVSRGLPFM